MFYLRFHTKSCSLVVLTSAIICECVMDGRLHYQIVLSVKLLVENVTSGNTLVKKNY